jgi:hypothetical protein
MIALSLGVESTMRLRHRATIAAVTRSSSAANSSAIRMTRLVLRADAAPVGTGAAGDATGDDANSFGFSVHFARYTASASFNRHFCPSLNSSEVLR